MPGLTEPGPWLALTCSNGFSAPYSPTFHSGSFKPHLLTSRVSPDCPQLEVITCVHSSVASSAVQFPWHLYCVTCGLYQVCVFLPPFVPTHSLPRVHSVYTVATMTTSLWHVSACWPVSLGIAGLPCHTHLGMSLFQWQFPCILLFKSPNGCKTSRRLNSTLFPVAACPNPHF